MIYNHEVFSESTRLVISGEAALDRLNCLCYGRYILIITGLFGFITPGVIFFVSFFLGILFHVTVHPYCGFFSGLRLIQSERKFIPLRKWMVNQSDKELSGSEYKEVMNRFSLPTQMKMKEIIKTQNCLYVYDAVNLLIFDMQYGAQAELQSKDDELKSNLKGKF